MNGLDVKLLLEHLHQDSFGWALFCCGQNPDEAEDALQTAYLKVLEERARYDGKASFRTWLFSVIRKTTIDLYRRKRLYRLRFFSFSEQHDDHMPHGIIEISTNYSNLDEQFHSIVSMLSNRQQEVIQLVYYHELTLEEAAGVLDISIGSVRTHYARAKKRLRQLINIYNEKQCVTN